MSVVRERGTGSARSVRAALLRARREVPRLTEFEIGSVRSVLLGVGLAILAIVAKAVLTEALGANPGFVILTAGVVLAAWVAGLPAGLAYTIVAGILDTLVFIGPEGSSFIVTPLDLARTGLFMVGGVVISLVIASLRTSRHELAATLDEVATLAGDIERRDERLELVLAASGTGFWEWDIRTGALVWSDAIFRQHGLDPAGTPPTFEHYVETVHPDDRATFQGTLQDAIAGGSSFSHEFRILWPDGTVHWTHGVGRVFRDAEGTAIRMVGTGQDITERRRLEEERDRLLEDERRAGAFREAFIDVISHELRTPITTILGLTQILVRPGRDAPEDDDAALVADIADESERLHRLVEDLLVLTRAERGAISIESEPLEIRRLLVRVVAREAARLPAIAISTDLPRELPIVAGDDLYVEQIVRNMLGNAAKYTPIGTRVVVRAEADGDTVAIRVLDDGPGIEPETAERAFELFFRDATRARTVAGSGIGLFVCARLVEAMGGSIWARRRPEGGSEFGFSLRAIPDEDGGAVPTAVGAVGPAEAVEAVTRGRMSAG